MDVQVPRDITDALRSRDVDVLTAQEDGERETADHLLLDRSTTLGRILFTRDKDFLREGALRQRTGQQFVGIIYGAQLNVSVGECISELELAAFAGRPDEFANQVRHLPLR